MEGGVRTFVAREARIKQTDCKTGRPISPSKSSPMYLVRVRIRQNCEYEMTNEN
jgi:hypothetical protein